jgi:alpha-glucosidase
MDPASGVSRALRVAGVGTLMVASTLARPPAAATQQRGGTVATERPLVLASPDGRNEISFALVDSGVPTYRVRRDGRDVVRSSRMGFTQRGAASLAARLHVVDTTRASHDETWTQPWGEVARIRDHHRELVVTLEGEAPPHLRMRIVFRAFDDGVAFRYELPAQPGLHDFEIMDEATEFALAENDKAWWIQAQTPGRYEMLYTSGPVSTVTLAHTPLTLESPTGLKLAIHEAALTDWAAMTLRGTGTARLKAELVRWKDGVAVRGSTPAVSPWRTIQMADRAGDLVTSYMVLDLNEPSKIADTSWIRPMKYVGIWWGMHIDTMTWSSGPKHGATTANTRRYIDFAAQHGFGGVLVEGWNVGWDGDWSANGDKFSFTQPYPDYDLTGLAGYARQKGVTLIAHNETSMGVENYERQLDDAYSLYERLGIHAVKTGYVGDATRTGEPHHGQYMVRHWRKVVEAAARHHLMLDVHEPIKDTGIRRTWPNMMTREGARGQEYNAWSQDGGNPPEHTTILPFTRLLASPMDFTPGIFALEDSQLPGLARVRTTLAKQLALYVVIYSPLQMAADLPEHYRGQPGFQFIEDVPVDWETTLVPDGEIGDYITVVRKDRHSQDWYVGSITDEHARTLSLSLSFLDPGRRYVAEIYADGPEAGWMDRPYDLDIRRQDVDTSTTLRLELAAGGGEAIRIRPVG